MSISRSSKIKDVWQHPVGRDVLQALLRQQGRSPKWPDSPLVGRLPITVLDRLGGPGFVDMLLDLAAGEADLPQPPANERKAWWKEAVVYQVFLPSFMDSDHDGVGDLTGIMQRLPYLSSLGVDVLWLWPVLEQGSQGGVRSWDGPSEEFGTLEEFCQLVEQARPGR